MQETRSRMQEAGSTRGFPHNPLLIIISGPAGVGKDAVLRQMKERAYPLHFVVTATDRAARPGEAHGVDYFFSSTAEFERMEREDELLEHAIVYGQHKGIPKQQVREALASGRDVIMRLDVQGAATVHGLLPDAVLVFLAATKEELIRRLQRRGSEAPEQLARRLDTFEHEMRQIEGFDYIVFNHEGHLDDTVDQVAAIIRAEHCRVRQRVVQL